jgi:prepilin-type processing-associated H-X9-DG protein
MPGKPYTKGICNVLFLDGHAQSVDRAELPSDATNGPNQIIGTGSLMLNNKYIWNSMQ